MTGAEFIAYAISTGSVCGVKVGDSVERFDGAVPLSHVDDVSGRGNSRTLRRDSGLLEATFGGSPAWSCQALSLQIHRMVHSKNLRDEVSDKLDTRFEPFTSWADVQFEYDRIPGSSPLDVLGEAPDYRILQNRTVGVSVHIVNDSHAVRGDYPGIGDIWSLEMISPRFM
ncbi:hypothetical protein OG944_38675 (plasmid) [Streptomyces anulatus]|uniref:hypothetical protein n=1 Tax=Streptomyces anulatus TaxID=1892 RepID=UPI002F90CE04